MGTFYSLEEMATLDKNRWNIEKQTDKTDIVVDITDLKQTVYLFKCTGCVVKVNGKCTNVTVDGCQKTGVVFESVVSACEVINSKKVQVQSAGKVPNISIDN